MILNAVIKGGGGDDGIVKFSYTGSSVIDGNILRLLDSGDFTLLSKDTLVDLFLVGGGGGGGCGNNWENSSGTADFYLGGGGGGGGYTHTQKAVILSQGTTNQAIIGAGGAQATDGGQTAFVGFTANGGAKATNASASSVGQGKGGAGGSGGGNGGSVKKDDDGNFSTQYGAGSKGGADGANSSATGQGTTTRAFGETDGELFSTGGDGGGLNKSDYNRKGADGGDNTGNGGGGGVGYTGNTGGKGGSGIILIRFPEGTELAQVA